MSILNQPKTKGNVIVYPSDYSPTHLLQLNEKTVIEILKYHFKMDDKPFDGIGKKLSDIIDKPIIEWWMNKWALVINVFFDYENNRQLIAIYNHDLNFDLIMIENNPGDQKCLE